MNEWNLIGHDWAVRRLKQQIDVGQVVQSHLIIGPPSVGKAALAKALARAILTQGARDQARAQRLVGTTRHPDLTWIGATEGSIKVELIRELIHTLTLAPLESRQRVAVIDDAQLATDSSKNALLKTLEEPNPSAVIILISPRIEGMLPTMTSRCQVVNLRPVARHVIFEALVQKGIEQTQAALVSRLARGLPGWALRATESVDLLELRNQRLGELETLLSSGHTKRFEYAEGLSRADDQTIQSVLGEWLLFWRDIVRACGTPDHLGEYYNVDHTEMIFRTAEQLNTTIAVRMLRQITNTLQNIQLNGSTRLALDVLFLEMPVM